MKKIIALFAFTLSLSLISCGPTPEDAQKYNDKLVDLQLKIFDKESALFEAIGKNQKDKLDTLFVQFSKQVAESKSAVTSMELFDKNDDLRKAAIKVLETYEATLKTDYPKLVKLSQTPDSLENAEISGEIMDLQTKIDSLLDPTIDNFINVQTKFASRYQINIMEADSTAKK